MLAFRFGGLFIFGPGVVTGLGWGGFGLAGFWFWGGLFCLAYLVENNKD